MQVDSQGTRGAGGWNDLPCDSQAVLRAYVCEVPNWVYFTTPLSWYDAQATCEEDGGSLVTVLSEERNDALMAFVSAEAGDDDVGVWLGATDLEVEGYFEWLTGAGAFWTIADGDLLFANWDEAEPNNVDEEECVEMDLPSGLWNDLDCEDELRNFVCELRTFISFFSLLCSTFVCDAGARLILCT